MRVLQAVPKLGQGRMIDIQHRQNAHCHKQQRQGENGINLADNLVDGQHRGQHIIKEDHHNPKSGVQHLGRQIGQQARRPCHKDGTHQHHQNDRKHAHHLLGGHTQVAADKFGKALAIMTHGEHTGQIVMHGSRKDASQHNPQIRSRAELGTHDGTEDGTQSRNVEELNHEYLPSGHRDIVHSVGLGQGGRLAVIRTEDPLHDTTVEKITGNQRQQTKGKCYHRP